MAAPGRRTDPSLKDHLFEHAHEFDFFQAVRLLGRIFPERKAIGGTAKPQEEIVRFGARVSTAFPASAVHELKEVPDSSEPPRMTVAFLALHGIQGVLPLWYTEWMLERKTQRDETLAAFLDIFNHRLLSLFYRAWEKHCVPALYEAAALRDQEPDPFTLSLYDVIGMGTAGLHGRLCIADKSLLLYAGLIAQRPHSASALRGILRDYFHVPIAIDQCIGDWYELEEQDRCWLRDESEPNQLGVGAFLGDEVWNQQSRFRLRIGPLAYDAFRQFLPDGNCAGELSEWSRYLVGQAMTLEVQLFLRADEVPYCRLTDEGPCAPRLGWTGWLKTDPFQSDAGDAVFTWVN